MSSIRPTIRLSDLVGRLLVHDREKKDALWQRACRRAVPAALRDRKLKLVKLEDRAWLVSPDYPFLTRDSAKKAKRLVTNRRRRLKQVSEGTMTTAELRRRDPDAFEILQKHARVAHAKFLNEEVHRHFKEGGAEAVLKPTAWKYAVAQLSKVAPISLTPHEHELYGEDAYEERLKTFGVKVAAGDPVDDELAVQFARLDREGYTEELRAELWDKYPNDAADAKLPKPSGDTTGRRFTARGAAELYAKLTDTKFDRRRAQRELRGPDGEYTEDRVIERALPIIKSKPLKEGGKYACPRCNKRTNHRFSREGLCRDCLCQDKGYAIDWSQSESECD